MKRFNTLSGLAVTALLCLAVMVFALSASAQHGGEGFGVKEYDDFHVVLHELQHEALPKNDLPRIRAKAGELVKLGKAIVQLGVPQGTAETKVEEFKKALKNFNDALTKFNADAKGGTDQQLKVSYSSVHESFETLADLLPRK